MANRKGLSALIGLAPAMPYFHFQNHGFWQNIRCLTLWKHSQLTGSLRAMQEQFVHLHKKDGTSGLHITRASTGDVCQVWHYSSVLDKWPLQ